VKSASRTYRAEKSAMNFLYFIPTKAKAITKAKLAEIGLAYAVSDNVSVGSQDCPRGPGDASGIIVSLPRKDSKGSKASPTHYKPDQQTWMPDPDGRFWVGLNKGERPGPEDLRKAELIDGEPVELRDRNKWTVPIVRSYQVGGGTLPKELVLGPDGRTWLQEDLTEYFALCAHADRVWPLFYGTPREATAAQDDSEADNSGGAVDDAPAEIDWQDGIGIGVEALAVNYRVSALEVSMLRLLSTETIRRVLQALVDLPNFVRVMESRRGNARASETSSTGDGSEATSPATSPPSVT
jgi:hypothetical protein